MHPQVTHCHESGISPSCPRKTTHRRIQESTVVYGRSGKDRVQRAGLARASKCGTSTRSLPSSGDGRPTAIHGPRPVQALARLARAAVMKADLCSSTCSLISMSPISRQTAWFNARAYACTGACSSRGTPAPGAARQSRACPSPLTQPHASSRPRPTSLGAGTLRPQLPAHRPESP